MALPLMENTLHPREEPQTTSTLTLQQFLQKSLPVFLFICIFTQGEEMSQLGTSVSNKQQGKLCQVSGTSGERLCVQRRFWGNPEVTVSGKGALYLWKYL